MVGYKTSRARPGVSRFLQRSAVGRGFGAGARGRSRRGCGGWVCRSARGAASHPASVDAAGPVAGQAPLFRSPRAGGLCYTCVASGKRESRPASPARTEKPARGPKGPSPRPGPRSGVLGPQLPERDGGAARGQVRAEGRRRRTVGALFARGPRVVALSTLRRARTGYVRSASRAQKLAIFRRGSRRRAKPAKARARPQGPRRGLRAHSPKAFQCAP